jgi:hypothetical protein
MDYSPHYQPEEFMQGIQTVTMEPGDSLMSAAPRLQRNHYGSFFYNRAKYYVIERPSNQLMDIEISRASLHYFDNKLYKVHYLVASDASYELINKLPRFSIRPLNQESANCLKNEPPVLRLTDKTIILNPNLDNYELIWKKQDKVVKWRCLKSQQFFEYSEIDTGYVRKYRELEQYENEQNF